MRKSRFTALLLALILSASFLSLTACGGSSKDEAAAKSEYGLNEAAEGDLFTVTALEVLTSAGDDFISVPEEGNHYIGVKFEISNASDEEQALSSLMQFESYADDTKTDIAITGGIGFDDGTLDGALAVDKKTAGWYVTEAPVDTKIIEIVFQPDILSDVKYTFKLDVPQQ